MSNTNLNTYLTMSRFNKKDNTCNIIIIYKYNTSLSTHVKLDYIRDIIILYKYLILN